MSVKKKPAIKESPIVSSARLCRLCTIVNVSGVLLLKIKKKSRRRNWDVFVRRGGVGEGLGSKAIV